MDWKDIVLMKIIWPVGMGKGASEFITVTVTEGAPNIVCVPVNLAVTTSVVLEEE